MRERSRTESGALRVPSGSPSAPMPARGSCRRVRHRPRRGSRSSPVQEPTRTSSCGVPEGCRSASATVPVHTRSPRIAIRSGAGADPEDSGPRPVEVPDRILRVRDPDRTVCRSRSSPLGSGPATVPACSPTLGCMHPLRCGWPSDPGSPLSQRSPCGPIARERRLGPGPLVEGSTRRSSLSGVCPRYCHAMRPSDP